MGVSNSLAFLGRVLSDAGELPPLSPADSALSWPEGPAVTWKSQFSLEMRYSSWQKDARQKRVRVRRRSADEEEAAYFELRQVGGALPVLVVADARHAGEADGDAVGRVHLRLGKLGACDLPHGRLLGRDRNPKTNKHTKNDKTIQMENTSNVQT